MSRAHKYRRLLSSPTDEAFQIQQETYQDAFRKGEVPPAGPALLHGLLSRSGAVPAVKAKAKGGRK